MPAFRKTEPDFPAAGTRVLEEFGLTAVAAGRVVSVGHPGLGHRLYAGGREGFERLLALLDAERDRAAREIAEDAARGLVDPARTESLWDLEEQVDGNLYASGARSADGAFGDEIREWSDVKGRRHVGELLAHGVIGAGVEAIDPDDVSASEAFAAFHSAVLLAVDRWIRSDGLTEARAESPSRPVRP